MDASQYVLARNQRYLEDIAPRDLDTKLALIAASVYLYMMYERTLITSSINSSIGWFPTLLDWKKMQCFLT